MSIPCASGFQIALYLKELGFRAVTLQHSAKKRRPIDPTVCKAKQKYKIQQQHF